MLRSTRSLPSLRVLNNTLKNEIQQQTQIFSSASTRYNLNVPNIPYYQTSIPKLFVRSVHQTNKKDSSTLLQSKQSDFGLLSLNSLKVECRKRGLRVSGSKAALVSRIQTFESSHAVQADHSQSMSSKRSTPVFKTEVEKLSSKLKRNFTKAIKNDFNKTTRTEAKSDDSHIDFIKPVDIEIPTKVEDDYIVKIPSLSTKASKTPVTELEKELAEESINPNITVVSKTSDSDSIFFQQNSIESIEGQNKDALKVSAEDLFKKQQDEKYEYDESDISSKDKTIWASALATVGLWWALKPKNTR